MTTPGMQIVRHRDLNSQQARALTDRIRSSMGDLMMLVAKAHSGRVWIALGYESWRDYIKGEFEHAPLHLPRDERRAVVALLRGQGMSTRAIEPAVGVGHGTVVRDLATGPNGPVEPEPVPVTGLDGRNYTITDRRPSGGAPTPPDEPEVVQPAPLITVTCPTCGGTGKVTQ